MSVGGGRTWALPVLFALMAQVAGPLAGAALAWTGGAPALGPEASEAIGILDQPAVEADPPSAVAVNASADDACAGASLGGLVAVGALPAPEPCPSPAPPPEDDCAGCSPPAGPAQAEAPVQSEASPPGGAPVNAAAEAGDCEDGEPPGTVAACAEEFQACAEEADPGEVPECGTTLAAGLVAIVGNALPCDPAAGDCPPSEDPPCASDDVQCQLQQVRDETCPDGDTCAPVDVVLACLDTADTADAADCAAGSVAGIAAEAVCSAVAAGDADEESQPTCQQHLEACAGAEAAACQDALDWLRAQVAAMACAPDAEGVPCQVATQVNALLACDDAVKCGFQAVWAPAVPAICGVVGDAPDDDPDDDEEPQTCAEALEECEAPGEAGCEAAARYLAERADQSACGADPAGACQTVEPARPCAGPGGTTQCQPGLQRIAGNALCADEECAEQVQDCAAAGCLLAVFDALCEDGDASCTPEVRALRPCVEAAADGPCADPRFWSDLAIASCQGQAPAKPLCPVEAHVEPPPSVTPPEGNKVEAPLPISTGSAELPFYTVTAALTALRTPAAHQTGLRGPINVAAGAYGGFSVGPREAYPDDRDLTLIPASGVTLTGPIVLTAGHGLSIQEPTSTTTAKMVVPAVTGPERTASLELRDRRAYVGHPAVAAVTAGVAKVATPERLDLRLTLDGDSALGAEDVIASGVTLTAAGGVLTGALGDPRGGLEEPEFTASSQLRLTFRSPGAYELTLEMIGRSTGYRYATASEQLRVGVPPAAPTPPTGTPRTAEDEVPEAIRLAGPDRAATAASVSRQSFPDGSEQVFVATGASFADALSAGPAAASTGSPVVLVERDRIPDATLREIERLEPTVARLLGGVSAIGPEVEAQIQALGTEVTRLRGDDRYATAAAVSAAHFAAGVGVAYIANGDGFADALSGGAAAAALGGPVLLVQRDQVPAATSEELRRLAPGRLVVLGGEQAVSEAVATQLRLHAEVRRVSGPTRYATSAAVSRDAFTGTVSTVFVATGATFPDALAGVPAAGAQRAPLLLVEPDRLPLEVAAELDRLRPQRIVILGGERSVSQRLERELRSYQIPSGQPS